MSGYSTIHELGNADFDNYQYHEVYLIGGNTVTIKGESFTPSTDITLPIGITSTNGTSGTMYLIGKKKPEAYRSADGTYPIKG